MPVQKTEKIWHNGKLIGWDEAMIHVTAHVISYGSALFEGIRCYATPAGPAIFRAREHAQRLVNSCRIYRIELAYSAEELVQAMVELVRVNKMPHCYLRPIVLRGYGEVGVNPFKSPIETYIACWPWGGYLGEEAIEQGVDVCVSSWARMAPNTLPAMAKSAANYMNSQLIKMEASCPASPATPSSPSPATSTSLCARSPSPAKCFTSPTKFSSAAPPPKSRPSAPSTRSRSAAASAAR